MAKKLSTAEKQILNIIPKMPVAETLKKDWIEAIQADGLSDEIVNQIRSSLSTPSESEDDAAKRTGFLVKLTTYFRQWQLTEQSKHFSKH